MTPTDEPVERRRTDGWLFRFWEFVDKRDLDKHCVSLLILAGTVDLTRWAESYATHADRPGFEVAAIIAAVTAPYMALQAAAIAFYFKARQ
jgi:hypothetical protein